MKDYEDRKYELWRDTTEQLLPTLMKKSLLMKVQCPAGWGRGEAGRREAGTAQRQSGNAPGSASLSLSFSICQKELDPMA